VTELIDYLGAFADVPEGERRLAAATRELLERSVMPRIADLYESSAFPSDIIPALAEIGLFVGHGPEHDEARPGPLAWGLAQRELERCDSGLRSLVSVQSCLAMTAIERSGSADQRAEWLPAMRRGVAIGCFGLTEPEHGSDPSGMETRAQRTAEGWRLDGHKRWVSNSPIARVAVIWAKSESSAATGDIRGFLVPLPWPGVEVRPLTRKQSLRVSPSGEVLLKDVRLPESARLPGAEGLGAALACLNEARTSIAWGAVGAAEACLDMAREHTGRRVQFGRPLAGFQLVQERLVAMLDDLISAQLVARRLAELKVRGALRHPHISFAKRHNVAAAQRIAARARALLGAEGIITDRHVMRHMANLESVATYEGTDEIHTLILGADLTGLSAFR